MIFRVWIVAALALGALTAGAEDRFVLEVTNRIDLTQAGLTDDAKQQLFADVCNSVAKKKVDGAQIILVSGSLEMKPGEKAFEAVNKLFASYSGKIALLCNCPDFADMARKGVTFSTLKSDALVEPAIVINGNKSRRCLDIYGHVGFSSYPYKSSNHIGLIYGVEFKDGRAEDGGGVRAGRGMRFVNCKFTGCEATGGNETGGGGVSTPVPTQWLTYAFIPRQFGLAFTNMTQSSCSFCKFTDCRARNNGGGVYFADNDARDGPRDGIRHCLH